MVVEPHRRQQRRNTRIVIDWLRKSKKSDIGKTWFCFSGNVWYIDYGPSNGGAGLVMNSILSERIFHVQDSSGSFEKTSRVLLHVTSLYGTQL